jgi:hypothetical protein
MNWQSSKLHIAIGGELYGLIVELVLRQNWFKVALTGKGKR